MRRRARHAVLRTAARLVFFSLLAHAFAAPAEAQERRGRRSPGLVLETGARHAACDAVAFTPDGSELLTAGDDKVVRRWPVDAAGILGEAGRVLRWPIYRERRGGIHAMALSPDARHVAVTGYGVKDGLVMVLDRASGEVVHVLDDGLSAAVNWALAWSPDGRFLVFGNEVGDVFRWEPGARAGGLRPFAGKKEGQRNRVRLLAFTDATHFLSVAQDGKVWLRDVEAPDAAPAAPIAALAGRAHQTVCAAAFSRASKRLAACQDYRPGRVLWMDLSDALAGKPGAAKTQYLLVPEDKRTRRYAWSLAFDARGERLAAGTRDATESETLRFSEVIGGVVFVYSLAGPAPQFLGSKAGLDCGYAVEALAFRPGTEDQLATAGGPNHEVRVWSYRKPAEPLSEVRSPGSCLWAVAVDAKGEYLAWREQPKRPPSHANDRGDGPWRCFKLDRSSRHILPRPPAGFTPVKPLDTLDGWAVRPTVNSAVWEVVEKQPGEPEVVHRLSARTGLYNSDLNQLPRCYTFLSATEAKPVRLAVGHMWGVSLYELRPGKVELARYMAGHEGEVMALAPSPDGKLLYTASRDQTLACWSLEDWPFQGELGAGFRAEKGGLVVAGVAPGSPAWEMGLTDGDEVVFVLSRDRSGPGAFFYDSDPGKGGAAKYGLESAPEMRPFGRGDLLKHFERPEPGREYIFGWRHGKGAPVQRGLTTLPQRPLWRFFPTRREEGSQWVLWRWRDFYYDTMSPRPDQLVGWHVYDADNLKVAPAFHPLGRFGGRIDDRGARVDGFYDPDRVWKFLARTRQEPEKVIFPQIEPPRIASLALAGPPPDKDTDLKLDVRVVPHDARAALREQRITRVVLWHDDARVPKRWHLDPATGAVRDSIVIPRDRLRQGGNRFKLVAFNAEGGRAEQTIVVPFADPARPKPTLRGLCVGIDKYAGAKLFGEGYTLDDLNYSVADARLMDQVLRQQEKSELFARSRIEKPLLDRDATAERILESVRALGRDVGPDDWVVLFLSGHGLAGKSPAAFCYVCADSAEARPASLLRAEDLHDVLRDIPCRKLIFLDSCHSGHVARSPIRGLNRDGVEFLIFSACKPHQPALEPSPELVAARSTELRPHGLFTQALMGALGYPEEAAKGRPRPVTDRELADKVSGQIRSLLRRLGKDEMAQEPEYFPERKQMRGLRLLSRP